MNISALLNYLNAELRHWEPARDAMAEGRVAALLDIRDYVQAEVMDGMF